MMLDLRVQPFDDGTPMREDRVVDAAQTVMCGHCEWDSVDEVLTTLFIYEDGEARYVFDCPECLCTNVTIMDDDVVIDVLLSNLQSYAKFFVEKT